MSQGLIYAILIADAVDPFKCIRCLQRKDSRGVNTICSACDQQLRGDRAQYYLYKAIKELYKFWIALLKKTQCNKFTTQDSRFGDCFAYSLRTPGVSRAIDLPRHMQWKGEDGVEGSRALGNYSQELLEQVLLTDLQCHNAMLIMGELMENRLVKKNRAIKIEEIMFKPRHKTCANHWTFRVTLPDNRRFAVNFTDRQLGWLRLVVPWEDYVREHVELNSEGLPSMTEHDLGVVEKLMRNDCSLYRTRFGELPFNMVLGECPPNWVPGVAQSDVQEAEDVFKCRLREKVSIYYAAWKNRKWD